MIIQGKTQKGKNVVKIHGSDWSIIRAGRPECFDGDFSFFIRSATTKNARWVRAADDTNFSVTL